MDCPPSKRQRRLAVDASDAPRGLTCGDPFGDEEDFTQDDLDEMDVMASQAFPRGEEACGGRAVGVHGSEVSRPQQLWSDPRGALSLQHAELKRKLKEVEEELLLKNGEIRLLRDSLKGAQQEKEAQRQSQMLLDHQRLKEQSHKEKELLKKVQALQSQLQFKEAEMNELKTRLLTSDRKRSAAPPPGLSPRAPSDDSGASSSPLANGFITKELFETHLPSKAAPGRTRAPGDRGSFSRAHQDPPDPFLSRRPAALQRQGRVLLGLLLQQPLAPSSLGLPHLLSLSLTSSAPPTGCPRPEGAAGGGASTAALTRVQSLARNGLNMLSQSQAQVSAGTRGQSACLGALLFLPLVDFYLSECLEALRHSSSSSSSSSWPTPAGPDPPWRLGSGFSVEEVALATWRVLHLLLSHSDEVVEAVLNRSLGSSAQAEVWMEDRGAALCSQNALLQSLLRLCEGGVGGSAGSHLDKLGLGALKTLCVLIQRAPHSHSESWGPVLRMVAAAVSPDSRLRTVSACVHVLLALSRWAQLGQQLCLQHDQCVLLKLFQFIRTRPDDQGTEPDWVELDLQVVRLLSRMLMQRSEVRLSGQQPCQCHSEMVQTTVLVLHRQWLSLSAQQPGTSAGAVCAPWWLRPAASLLREAVLLLHWLLLLHHSSFSQSCRPLLHMYDQLVPAVQDLLRGAPERSQSEEVALEEICRSDADDPEDVQLDAAS